MFANVPREDKIGIPIILAIVAGLLVVALKFAAYKDEVEIQKYLAQMEAER